MGSSQAEPSTTGWLNTAWFATCRRPRLATPGLLPARREGWRCCDGQQTNQQKGGCNTWGSVHRGPLPGRFSRTASKQATGSLGRGIFVGRGWIRESSDCGISGGESRSLIRGERRTDLLGSRRPLIVEFNLITRRKSERWVSECEMGLNLTLMRLSRDNQHTCIASA